jgi:C4-dicarboxylate-specific signal transduction histidine kinase
MNTTPISLHKLASGLLQSLLPLTTKRRTLVLNEIPRDLHVRADENMLAYVLWNLINAAVQSTQDDCIHIEAAVVDDRVMVRVKNAGVFFHRSIAKEYRQIQHVAEQLGGGISVEGSKNYGTDAAFCVANTLEAA